MSTTPHHEADRETLSALFDGELDDAAARFAMKRIDHDRQWREACGRWQLMGDALRGQASGVAPVGFADRVGAALAEEHTVAATKGSAALAGRMPVRRHWIGGAALAASVAVAALFVTRPLSPDGAPPSPASQVATGAQPTTSVGGATESIAATPPAAPARDVAAPSLPAAETGFAAATVAAADVSRRTGERRSRERGQPGTADSARPREIDAAASSAVIASTDAVPSAVDPASPHPFLPPGEIVSRPWPRATLANYPTGNAFNVSFDNRAGTAGQASSSEASSFYPFDPRMLEAESMPRPAADAPDWPRR